MVDPVADAFEPVLGLAAWLVRQGHGAFLTLEFGEPKLEVGEPRQKSQTDDGVRYATRTAVIRGDWHLWIYCCRWTIAADGRELADGESGTDAIRQALHLLNGQILTGVDVASDDGSSVFTFDLGATLSTTPASPGTYGDEPIEQWMLYQPSGLVLSIRSDGTYNTSPATEAEDSPTWSQLHIQR